MKAATPSIFRRLTSLAAPIIGLNVLNVLALGVDTAMCGRLPDAEIVLTALSFSTQIVFLLMVAMMGVTVGAVALISRAHGAGDHTRLNHIFAQAVMLTLLVSFGITILGNIFAPQILLLLGASPESIDAALLYLRPLLLGVVFSYLNLLFAAVLRGIGNTRLPFFVALLSNTLNFILNYGFILGNMGFPAWGIFGAALGTVISQSVAVLVLYIALKRGKAPPLSPPTRFHKLDRSLAMQLIRVGIPASFDMVILNASFLSIVGMLGRINGIAVAAHGIGLRIQALAFVPGMSISQATGAMVGQALGAKNVLQARQVVRASLILCVGIMSMLAAIIIFAVEPIVAIFDVVKDSPLEFFSIMWIELLGYCMPIVGIYISFVGLLQGSGSTKTSLRINLVATLLFQIPLSALLGFVFEMGAYGVWLAFPLSFLVKSLLGMIAYRRGRWAKIGVEVT